MFEWSKKYSNEQEIIDAGCDVIYFYCSQVKGRWRDIEHLMIKSGFYGYYYARDVIKGRYEPELETVYLMRHSDSHWVSVYRDRLINAPK